MPRFAHTAFEHIAYAQLLSDFLDIDGLAFVGEGRGAGDDRKGAPPGEQSDDVLGDAVGKELLLRITAEIFEGQDRYRAAIIETGRGRRSEPRRCSARALLHDLTAEPEDPDRLGDVFEVMRPEVLEVQLDPAGDAVADDFRDVDAARLGQCLKPRRNVDAVAENIAVLDDDVVEIDPYAEPDPLFG